MKFTKMLPPLALVSALALVPVTASSFAAADTTNYQELEKFMSVYERVKANYVDKVDDHTLIKGAIDGMLAALDPHSSYAEDADFQSLKTTTDGNYGGLGITVSNEDGAVKVIAPTEDTPAWRAGIKSGDYITHVNGELLYGMTVDEAVDKMRGDPGTSDQADHRSPRPRQAVRRYLDPRTDRAPPGQVGDQGRHRLHQHQHLLGQRRRPDQVGAAVDRQGDQWAPARLCRRPALEPGRPARPGRRRQRRLPRQRRNRLAARPREGRHRALLREARRHGARPSGHRPGRRRYGFGLGNRRRRAAGPSPRPDHGREQLRQGLGPDRRPDRAAERRCG